MVLAAEPGHLRADRVGGQHRGLAVEGFDFLADGEVFISDGAAGDFLWRSQISQLSEFLLIADPGGEVIGEAGRVGSLGLLGDLLVVLEFVDQHGHSMPDGAFDESDFLEGVCEPDATLDEPGGDLAMVFVELRGVFDPLGAQGGACGVAAAVADYGQFVLEPIGVVPPGFCRVGIASGLRGRGPVSPGIRCCSRR